MRVSIIAFFWVVQLACSATQSMPRESLNVPHGLQQASRHWRDVVTRGDSEALVGFAETDATKRALRESLSDLNDPLTKYFFYKTNSVSAFFRHNKNLSRKIVHVDDTKTFYVCYYDSSRFHGHWSLDLLRGYSLDLDSIVCESFYESNGIWYLDFDMPIFDGD